MAKQTKGKCHFCNAEYTKSGMIKHLLSCKEWMKVLDAEKNKKSCGYFTLLVNGKYNKDYWLVIDCKEDAKLIDLDQFLRDIWLECCGHLSAFKINGISYDCSAADADIFASPWDEPAESMDYKLNQVLEKCMKFEHEYDFGSTTELVITVSDYAVRPWKKDKITLLSRNNPVEYVCSECGKMTAVSICTKCIYEENGFLCEACETEHECGEEMLIPICNSPRCGVCGYTGSEKYGNEM